jgi:LmbE family N-acetylglucosaminyl deacetylase
MGDWKTELTGRVLVLVAHADDESVGYGALLQKMREPVLVIATDGAPRDAYFWGRFGSREAYAAVRREEAQAAMRVVGVRELVMLAQEDARLEDQRLFLNLEAAYGLLLPLADRVRPEAIATLAYEGGHPDHDSCNLLGARLGERLKVPVWEAPLYRRTYTGEAQRAAGASGNASLPTAAGADGEPELRVQQFVCENGSEARVEITAEELERKRTMCSQYASQGDFLQTFDARLEVVRPQVRYEYGRAPHAGRTNYECWQWWMSASEVSSRFAEFEKRAVSGK